MRTTTRARLDRLDEQLETYFEELSSYNHEQLNGPGKNGGWSAMQCLHHVLGAEKGSLAYVKKKLGFDPKLPKTNLFSRLRASILMTYMYLPFKFKAPSYIATDKLPPTSDFETTAAAFRAHREELKTLLDQLDPKWYDYQVLKHPLAGRISLNQMLGFFGSHFQRHRRQGQRALTRH